jgi:hypothetical protein
MNNKEISTCTVEGWKIGLMTSTQSVIFQLDYSVHALQSASAPSQTPTLVLTAQAAIELSEALLRNAHAAMQGSHGAGHLKH